MTTTTTTQITAPVPVYTHDFFASSSASVDKPEADFQTFGYTFSSSSTSRHDRRLSTTSLSSDTLPPSYSESHRDIVPEYATTYEPTTLAKYLFLFGFLFPPFWLMGALILISPLRPPTTPSPQNANDLESGSSSPSSSWLPEKSESERQAFISHIRQAELKYAKRCLIALIVFSILLTGIIGTTVWVTSK